MHVAAAARRRQGVAKALLRACVGAARAAGAYARLARACSSTNTVGETVWRRLGFEPVELVLAQPLDALDGRLDDAPVGPSRASTHIQSDDRVSVERAVGAVRAAARGRRRPTPTRAAGSGSPTRCSTPTATRRRGSPATSPTGSGPSSSRWRSSAARSSASGSTSAGAWSTSTSRCPTFYGAARAGDELALEANPTLVARLTGADREEVRRVARTAASPADLPPAAELYEHVARMMGLEP